MKNKDLKFIIIFIVIVSISFIYLFQTSYAKFRKKLSGNVDANIASWDIKVNNESINGKSALTNNITPTFLETEYSKDGVISPGSVGYYDINLDASEVDVSFTYKITSTVSIDSSISDLKTLSYTINPSTNTEKTTYNETEGITGSVIHNSSANTIRIYIEWNDSETGSMDNEADTNAAIDDTSKALIEANITFSQQK